MIYKIKDGKYIASSNGIYIPGCFEDERTAKYAFRFNHEDLQKLQDEKNNTNCIITFNDLKNLKIKNK